MHVMFTDIHNRRDSKIRHGLIDGLDFTEILYADDTLLATKNTKAMNALLTEIETESTYYNMALNKDKCHVIAMNKDNKVTFKDKQQLKRVDEVTYPGEENHQKRKSIPLNKIFKRYSKNDQGL